MVKRLRVLFCDRGSNFYNIERGRKGDNNPGFVSGLMVNGYPIFQSNHPGEIKRH